MEFHIRSSLLEKPVEGVSASLGLWKRVEEQGGGVEENGRVVERRAGAAWLFLWV